MLFASDANQQVGKAYGAARGVYDTRYLFVIDPTGHIAHRMLPFREMVQASYDTLQTVVYHTAGLNAP